ncbi:MAG TPA: chaperone modulator CbpM [Streptosporangiaceae bacterium]|nr:chaperone modulator CbpM [Streptosporangiaceae bacterium]
MTHAMVSVSPPVVRLDLDSFSRAAGVHPSLIRRFVALGLLEPYQDRAGALWFTTAQLRAVARIQRLRTGFSINYASLSLVIHLLDRIEELESSLRQADRTASRSNGGRPWT